MTHYVKTEDNKLKIEFEVGCYHPEEQPACSGNCEECRYCKAVIDYKSLHQLLKIADCLHLQ